MSDWDDLSGTVGLVPDEHIVRFEAAFNDPDGHAEHYFQESPAELLQGDILARIEFGEAGAVPAIVLSNSCDIQQGKDEFATAAPVVPLDAYRAFLSAKYEGEALEQRMAALLGNKRTNLLYLPPTDETSGLVAYLSRATALSLEEVRKAQDSRLLTLSQMGYWCFLAKLMLHFGRAESADVQRAMPQ